MTTQNKTHGPVIPAGTRVARDVGPMMTGIVVAPTQADRDRRMHELTTAELPAALVQWGYWRSWEYCADLRTIPGNPGDL